MAPDLKAELCNTVGLCYEQIPEHGARRIRELPRVFEPLRERRPFLSDREGLGDP